MSTAGKSLYDKYNDIMPQGAGALFFIQLVATIAYSVLFSTLVLYATQGLKLNDTVATSVTASFIAFNYALHLLGGYIGGRFLSYRSLFAIGMICQLAGCLLLSINSLSIFYWALAAFLTGAGINLTCINCMLTQLFQPHDKSREAAFLWNYSGMNIGFFLGFSISGYFQLHASYHTLFLLSGLGNLAALILVLFKWNLLRDIHTTFSNLASSDQVRSNLMGCSMIIALLFSLRWLLQNANVSTQLIMGVGVLMAIIMAYLAMQQPHLEQRNKIWAFLILGFASLSFWTLYMLAPMGLTLFIERNVDRHFFGIVMAPQWVQNINTIVIILGGPILSMTFTTMRNRGLRLTIPLQFSIALILIGISLAILPLGIYCANAQGYTHFNWILASYVLQSMGELFISPIGFAMVGQLAPPQLQGLMMGTWMMLTGVAATLSGYFSTMMLGPSHSANPLITNTSYSHTFNLLGWGSIVAGILLFMLLPYILHLTQEKKLFAQNQRVTPAGF